MKYIGLTHKFFLEREKRKRERNKKNICVNAEQS